MGRICGKSFESGEEERRSDCMVKVVLVMMMMMMNWCTGVR